MASKVPRAAAGVRPERRPPPARNPPPGSGATGPRGGGKGRHCGGEGGGGVRLLEADMASTARRPAGKRAGKKPRAWGRREPARRGPDSRQTGRGVARARKVFLAPRWPGGGRAAFQAAPQAGRRPAAATGRLSTVRVIASQHGRIGAHRGPAKCPRNLVPAADGKLELPAARRGPG